MRRATTAEIVTLLRSRSSEVRKMIGEPAAQLSVPRDAQGPRVLARLPRAPTQRNVMLVVQIDDEQVEVPVQLSGEFQRVRLLASSSAQSGSEPALLARHFS